MSPHPAPPPTIPVVSAAQPRLATIPIVALMPINMADANTLLEAWGHYLGACARPFRQEAYALELDGEPVSVGVSASIVSSHIEQWRRDQVVELARLCSAPNAAWATRVVLRHGRSFIGIELNPEYVEIARRRIVGDAPLLNVSAEVVA